VEALLRDEYRSLERIGGVATATLVVGSAPMVRTV
jgi:hypothetical protein